MLPAGPSNDLRGNLAAAPLGRERARAAAASAVFLRLVYGDAPILGNDTSEHPFVAFNGGLSCGVPKKKNTHVLEESVLKALIGTLKL